MFQVEGTHETVEAWVVHKENCATILLINHAQPRHPIQMELVHVRLSHAPEPRTVYVERIDDEHANSRRVWQEMGKPTYLSPFQVQQLKAASRLVKEPLNWKYQDQAVSLDIDLPPHSVAAITVEFSQAEGSGHV